MDKKTAQEIITNTAEAYNAIAEKFDQTRKKYPWSEFWEFKRYIKFGDNVLDIGCGNGRLLTVLKDLKINYTGLDISKELIKKAKINFPDQNFKVGNILETNIFKQYNHIFLLAVLHHIPSFELRFNLLRKIGKALKPGGYLFMTNWSLIGPPYSYLRFKNNLKTLFKLHKLDKNDLMISFTTNDRKIKVERFIHVFTKKELQNLADKTSFEIVKQDFGFKNFNHISIWKKI